jgi:NADPH:quinone reductase-like Zn-dependent oxidoreductase
MRAVSFTDYGPPEVLRVADAEEPHPDEGQIRIAVRAAGVNPVDWKARSGVMREMMPLSFPVIDGREASGVVDEVGPGVSDVAAGDEVFGFSVGGAAAERAVLDDYARKPPGLAWEDAAALPVAVETSLRVFNVLGGLEEGQTIVVNGAADGVGVAAVQIARARGVRVIGTASEGSHEFLRSLGAEPTTYGDGMVERIRALAPDGVDLAFDTAGKGGIPDLITLTGDPARVCDDRRLRRRDSRREGHRRRRGPRPGRPRRSGPTRRGGPPAPAGPADVHLRRGARGAPPERGWPRPRQARPRARLSGGSTCP